MVFSCWRCKLPQMLSFAEDDLDVHPDPEQITTHLRRFSLEELQTATNNFRKENIIGRGGYGEVYKGKLDDGSVVAVKRFQKELTSFVEVQFQTSIGISNMATHRNLLQLRGFCLTPNERLLVYPHMANGSLSYQLRERHESQPALNWEARKRIALGAAEGICYLHEECDPKIIHRDIKAANILLDEEFEPVVGDFGLAKLMDSRDTYVTDEVRGTAGHIPPEYLSAGMISDKTDVYGFGVMLLELVTGRRVCDLSRLADDEYVMVDWVKAMLEENETWEIVDPKLQGNYAEGEMLQMIKVALICVVSSPVYRPEMAEVVELLKGYGLDDRWVEVQEYNRGFLESRSWDSTELLPAVELSGPR